MYVLINGLENFNITISPISFYYKSCVYFRCEEKINHCHYHCHYCCHYYRYSCFIKCHTIISFLAFINCPMLNACILIGRIWLYAVVIKILIDIQNIIYLFFSFLHFTRNFILKSSIKDKSKYIILIMKIDVILKYNCLERFYIK